MAFSRDDKVLASGGSDKIVWLWDTETWRPKGRIIGRGADYVTSVAFSPKASVLASGCVDKTVQLWDAKTGGYIQKLTGVLMETLAGDECGI